MGAADDLAALGKEPTPAQLTDVYERNGIPLHTRYGKLVVPAGITPDMAAQLHRHEGALVSRLTPEKPKAEKPPKKEKLKDAPQL